MDGIEKGFEIIEKNAEESGNRKAFYHGLVFGLGQAKGFIEQDDLPPIGCIEALLDLIDERYFKVTQI